MRLDGNPARLVDLHPHARWLLDQPCRTDLKILGEGSNGPKTRAGPAERCDFMRLREAEELTENSGERESNAAVAFALILNFADFETDSLAGVRQVATTAGLSVDALDVDQPKLAIGGRRGSDR